MPARKTRRDVLKATVAAGAAVGAAIGTKPALADESDAGGEWAQYQYGPANAGRTPDAWGRTDGVQERWVVHTEATGVTSPVVFGGVLYVGDAKGVVRALDIDTGDELWRHEVPDSVSGSLAYDNGTIYAACLDNYLYAIDAETGEEEWSSWSDSSLRLAPTVVNNRIYLGNRSDETFFAYGSVTGTRNWTFDVNGPVTSVAAVSDRTVYFARRSTIFALDSMSGDEQWRYIDAGRVTAAPTVSGGTLFLASLNGAVHAVDTDTGEQLWSFETNDAIQRSPAVGNGMVYVGGEDNNVYALDVDTGELQWVLETDGRISTDPIVAGGMVYVGSHDRSVYGVEAATGTVLWELERTVANGSPAFVDGVLYLVNASGTITALDTSVMPTETPTPTSPHGGDPTQPDEMPTETPGPGEEQGSGGQVGSGLDPTDEGGLSLSVLLGTVGMVLLGIGLVVRKMLAD